jgi:hypothetical protein
MFLVFEELQKMEEISKYWNKFLGKPDSITKEKKSANQSPLTSNGRDYRINYWKPLNI